MTVDSFEREALRWALDEDSVQNLLISAAPAWKLTRQEAITEVRKMAEEGLFEFYENGETPGEFKDVDVAIVTDEYLQSRSYTWMAPTKKTFRRLNEINPGSWSESMWT